jgi:hypothetical protein
MNYEKQAQQFLHDTGTKLLIRWKETRETDFTGTYQCHDIYKVILDRGERHYIFDFTASVINTRDRLLSYNTKTTRTIHEKEIAKWGGGKYPQDLKIGAYDVLACLDTYEFEDLDEFAQTFGYTDKPSKAVEVFEAVQEETKNLKILFNEKEIEALREIV